MIINKIFSDEDILITAMKMMGNNKEHLLFFIKLCGFGNNHKEYKRIKFLIKNEIDLKKWISIFSIEYSLNVDFLSEVSDKFKEHKIKLLDIQINEFIVSCLSYLEPIRKLKNGLETLFQVECNDDEIKKINEKLHNNQLSLAFIYNKFKEDAWLYNSAGKFARKNWTLKLTV